MEVEMRTKRAAEIVAFGLALTALLCISSAAVRAQKAGTLTAAAAPANGEESSGSQPDNGTVELHRRYPRYKVQHSDTLSITFPLSPEFDQPKAIVQPDGYINLQGAPSIHIEGMTVPEVVDAIKKAYAGMLHEPIIEVDLVDFQRPYFTVSGQVGKPGEFELRHDTTLAEGIAMAGGFAPTAKTQVFYYHRVSPDSMEVKQFNIKDILHGKNVNEDPYLSSGDMIFVPEKFIAKFRKYVPYGVGTGFGFY
jgi:polysaccharide biosynthesis/export protein